MLADSPPTLKKCLFDEYEGFADKRIKKLENGSLFIVDDRQQGDYDARKQLFLWFCLIFAEVSDSQGVRVILRGGVPTGPTVAAWQAKHNVDISDGSLSFDVNLSSLPKLSELADAIAAITKSSYPVEAYKFVCPRTAASLKRLHSVLSQHWKQ